ncbi:hypothetical protein N7468_007330 [Penicillium chermesinum]|uniref:Uncharacterized protein n=1 Tax=Penicillium chermesinum TaxID=63820 RepID=A0A9W9NU51_9EURO|nr:uncharacterized protein N7468_007330 [Penicillium chermesinum]KAJ5226105.1 hypothetical protein N7468_007330 [Penicillium chermesinum]KAJ6160709.1 hypothetical protein N7470_004105 [Penicillium chermesinum]
MADVRSMLRSELASRKGTPPNNSGNRVSKKRKVDNGDGIMRKKLRSTGLDAVQAASDAQLNQSSAEGSEPDEELETAEAGVPLPETEEGPTEDGQAPEQIPASELPLAPPVPSQQPDVDEDEWAAFERDVAEPSRLPHAPAALSAEATISAAPVTTEEIAAERQSDKVSTARAREAELEGEREDAARFMEEEFDEMEQLEERVRRLKHMREELRQKQANDESTPKRAAMSEDQRPAESESDDDDDDDDDWDDWRFK